MFSHQEKKNPSSNKRRNSLHYSIYEGRSCLLTERKKIHHPTKGEICCIITFTVFVIFIILLITIASTGNNNSSPIMEALSQEKETLIPKRNKSSNTERKVLATNVLITESEKNENEFSTIETFTTDLENRKKNLTIEISSTTMDLEEEKESEKVSTLEISTTTTDLEKESEKVSTLEILTATTGEKVSTLEISTTTMDLESMIKKKTEISRNEEEENFLKCHPVNVFIKWSLIRMYLIKNLKKQIPNIYKGASLKVRRCLPFMTNGCDFKEKSVCSVIKEEVVNRNITLMTHNGNLFKYYEILFVQHKECACNEMDRNNDYPYDPPVIYYGSFIET